MSIGEELIKHWAYLCESEEDKASNNGDFEIEDGILVKYHGSSPDVVIPDGVTKIGKNAFRNCASLTSVDIPDSVTSIGYGAFYGCKSLISVTTPYSDSVRTIGDGAFAFCTSLTSVDITEGA
jgi:hypothetical protein